MTLCGGPDSPPGPPIPPGSLINQRSSSPKARLLLIPQYSLVRQISNPANGPSPIALPPLIPRRPWSRQIPILPTVFLPIASPPFISPTFPGPVKPHFSDIPWSRQIFRPANSLPPQSPHSPHGQTRPNKTARKRTFAPPLAILRMKIS